MKKFLSIMALAAIMASCNTGADADNDVDSAKERIDSVTDAKKDKLDSAADAQKDKLDSLDKGKDTSGKK